MIQHHQVTTVPGEPVAPEVYLEKNTINPEPGAHTQADDMQTAQIAIILVASTVLVFIMAVLLEAFYDTRSAELREARLAGPSEAVTQMVDEQQSQLEYRWADEKKTARAIPIDRAMDIVVQEEQAAQKNNPTVQSGERASNETKKEQ